jgi:hypothetical protein
MAKVFTPQSEPSWFRIFTPFTVSTSHPKPIPAVMVQCPTSPATLHTLSRSSGFTQISRHGRAFCGNFLRQAFVVHHAHHEFRIVPNRRPQQVRAIPRRRDRVYTFFSLWPVGNRQTPCIPFLRCIRGLLHANRIEYDLLRQCIERFCHLLFGKPTNVVVSLSRISRLGSRLPSIFSTPPVIRRQFANPVWCDKHNRGVSNLLQGSSFISGSSQNGDIDSSSESFPADASRNTVSAVTGLVSDAMLYSVFPVAETPGLCSPYTAVHATFRSSIYATATLGTSLSFNHSAAWASISARPSFLAATVRAVDCSLCCPAARIVPMHPITATTTRKLSRNGLGGRRKTQLPESRLELSRVAADACAYRWADG